MRCVLYRRVSTDSQREEGFSLEAQKMRLEAYVRSQGWTLVNDYADEGFSAKTTDRPALQQLIEEMKQQKFDIILVYRLDRFVRSVLDLHALLQLMDLYHVKFKSATEVFDTTSATGRMFISMIATLAQWERETTSERVFDSTIKKSEKGIRPGAPRPYGYNYHHGKLIMNEQEAKWVRFIYETYPTTGTQTIAKQLNHIGIRTKKGGHWDGTSIRYILTNPIYAGYVRWNYRGSRPPSGKRVLTGEEVMTTIEQEDFEPIVDQRTFTYIQKLLKARKLNKVRSDNHYPFSSVLRCGKCGHKYSGNTITRAGNRKYRFYRCTGRHKYGTCDASNVSEEAITHAFLQSLDYTADSPDLSAYGKDPSPSTHTKNEPFQLKKERAQELYLEGQIDKQRYMTLINKINAEELQSLEDQKRGEEPITTKEIKSFLQHLKAEWNNTSYESQKQAIYSTFESLTIHVLKKGTAGRNPKPAVVTLIDYRLRS